MLCATTNARARPLRVLSTDETARRMGLVEVCTGMTTSTSYWLTGVSLAAGADGFGRWASHTRRYSGNGSLELRDDTQLSETPK